jgi:hypothetical protein
MIGLLIINHLSVQASAPNRDKGFIMSHDSLAGSP